MQHLEVSGAVVLYIGRTASKGSKRKDIKKKKKKRKNIQSKYKSPVDKE
jgi:hypothetical protein